MLSVRLRFTAFDYPFGILTIVSRTRRNNNARQVSLDNSFGQVNTEPNMNLIRCLLLIVSCFNCVLPTYQHTLYTRVFMS